MLDSRGGFGGVDNALRVWHVLGRCFGFNVFGFFNLSWITACTVKVPELMFTYNGCFNRLEVPSFKLLGIIIIISFGVMLTGMPPLWSCSASWPITCFIY